MKKEEVPQDESSLAENNIRELYYAVDKEGAYTTELSSGWTPKTIVQTETLRVFNERIENAKENVRQGKNSPIVYFMELHRMDWPTLAAYMGKWVWTIKRHAKPSVFKRLKEKTLRKYATVFNITLQELTEYKGN